MSFTVTFTFSDDPTTIELGQSTDILQTMAEALKIKAQLGRIESGIQGVTTQMAKFDDDVVKLVADVQANTTAIGKFKDFVTANGAKFDALQKEFDDYKASHPDEDLSGLESAISAIEANNATAEGIIPTPVVVPPTVTEPTAPEPTAPTDPTPVP